MPESCRNFGNEFQTDGKWRQGFITLPLSYILLILLILLFLLFAVDSVLYGQYDYKNNIHGKKELEYGGKNRQGFSMYPFFVRPHNIANGKGRRSQQSEPAYCRK